MKKLILFFFMLSIASCDNRDYLNSNTKEVSSKLFSKNQTETYPEDLCMPYIPETVVYGNPNDYPNWNSSTYYSLSNPNNGQDWFFDVVKEICINYISKKYGVKTDWYIGTNDIPSGINSFKIKTQSISTIYPYDGNYYELYPNSLISSSATTYSIYRILSSIDNSVEYYFNTNLEKIKPKAICVNFDYTMCGNYLGLYFHVYYN
ncbi:hypothetical protein EIB75_08265 [Epilithonimonas vandammei]|uniref:Lipoprotein n=1 Tax=Epilithonimonas vandammei TaxID=2487072 RepID=A0A3G8ZF62_9FLAO|nr:hypothetical protein [Epilithonimonas vandammei]AZI55237.1 hypothetical protein EIB75_08265 [Epilithonimonas vandammei]